MKRCKHELVTVRTMVVASGRRAECQQCGVSALSYKRNQPKWAERAFRFIPATGSADDQR